ncbi:outer membrane lipoprotein-sorting protein [Methanosarcina mazei]|uniref:DUF4367 domain-containing protein n=3 Tax=Methanosarcina mazei TaxID=2209 RepID=A0A0F8H1M6_METMZ|nr:outer membrane lipoprotein-sorting protein [Methanosarcina mazei]AKB41103.1 hypothetical protein MSMAW_2112 [Methanosarcina mazei WWM610]AKB72084.1 hypothetical protein MSMAC_2194 [Methanosarcina mazei C16]KKG14436.1 hypothetical protein DU34_05640 [Methanosarcina mazei]KKG30539.1 hypothetical protein DU52_04435 [Methanosarcina mazei]KKG31441.1 hypothetical protein DU30_00775 [Methanosarcina mazei]
MLKKLAIMIFLLNIVASGCLENTNDKPNVEEIIDHTQEKYESIDVFQATIISTTNFQGEEVVQEMDFLFKKPKEYKCVHKAENLTTVSNGEVVWMYNSNKGEVTVGHLEDSEGFPDFDYGILFKDLTKTNNLSLIEDMESSGKSCYVIEAMPKNKTSIISQDIWIDKESWIPIRIDRDFGDYKSRVEYTNISVNADVSDNEFEFTLPKDAKIVEPNTWLPNQISMEEAQESVNFTILKPSYSAGYQFIGATVSKYADSVSLSYAKGRDLLTIVQTRSRYPVPNAENVTIGELKGEITETFGNKMIRYNDGDIYIIIAGTVSEEELIKIAESMI